MNDLTVRIKGHVDEFSLDIDCQISGDGVSALFGQSGSRL